MESLGCELVADDNAFSGSHARVLTPFTKPQLRMQRGKDYEQYKKMRSYNNLLSSQRITVERAFGILVRRFRCFKSAFERREKSSLLMIIVCVKVHNLCVERWKEKKGGKVPAANECFDSPTDAYPRASVDQDGEKYDEGESNEDTARRLEHEFECAPRRSPKNTLRLSYVNSIFKKGLEFSRDDD